MLLYLLNMSNEFINNIKVLSKSNESSFKLYLNTNNFTKNFQGRFARKKNVNNKIYKSYKKNYKISI